MAKEITVENLTKRFDNGRIVAVDNISLTIPEGSFTSILGPSGCGKTTFLRCIGGLETASEGEIYFGDKEVTHLTPQERDLSMVFQSVTLYPHMTCRENIEYPLKINDVPKEERTKRVEETTELLQIADQLDKSPTDLSGGQQQRIGLATAIVNQSDVILLDEPMSDLDAKLKADLRVELQELHQQLDTTMVYVTHDQEEAMAMTDNIIVMRQGAVEQVGEPTEIFQQPKTKYVGQFIGQPEMNMLPADDVEILHEEAAEIGIRPGNLAINPVGADFEFETEVNVVEPLGTDYIIHTTRKGSELTVVTRQIPEIEPGDILKVGFDLSKAHVFTKTGDRLEINQLEDITHE